MIVVKVGGGKDLNIDAIVADIVNLRGAGHELLLVHGGAETTNEVAEALGHPPQFVTSESGYVSRRTDRRTLEIFEMVYCGQLNKMWVEKLQMAGVNAVGLSGLDGRIFEGARKDTLRVRIDGKRMVLRDDWTGTVERINTHLLRTLLDAGYLPRAYSARRVGQGRGDQRGRRPRRGDGGRRLSRRGADHPQQRAWPAARFPRRVVADPRNPEIKGQRLHAVRRGAHEEKGDGRGRGHRRRRAKGNLRRRAS
jgi:hypothetical protein